MGLMDDYMLLMRARISTIEEVEAAARIRTFIEQHEPWLPPQQEGFGPWIEYKPGDKGPRIGDVVRVFYRDERDKRTQNVVQASPAARLSWHPLALSSSIVAYCVKLEDGE